MASCEDVEAMMWQPIGYVSECSIQPIESCL